METNECHSNLRFYIAYNTFYDFFVSKLEWTMNVITTESKPVVYSRAFCQKGPGYPRLWSSSSTYLTSMTETIVRINPSMDRVIPTIDTILVPWVVIRKNYIMKQWGYETGNIHQYLSPWLINLTSDVCSAVCVIRYIWTLYIMLLKPGKYVSVITKTHTTYESI